MPSWRQRLIRLVPDEVTRKVIIPVAHHVGATLVDSGNWILGQNDPLTPPQRLQAGGTGGFKIGFEFLRYFTELGALKSNEDVLDIGSGVGRMAAALTTYLKDGTYQGIDIVPQGVKWCQENITPRFPQFRFSVADIYNKAYNPSGRFRASEYKLPFPNASFDFVFLTSVFTHLVPEDAAHYLEEIGRVLRPGGRLLGTWFLLNAEARDLVKSDKAFLAINQPYQGRDDVLVLSQQVPEEAIAFDDDLVASYHDRADLKIQGLPHRGSWCGRKEFLSFQDIVVAKKSV